MIYDKLFGWQKEIVDKIKIKDSFGLFLDCGLGKTPVSLALAEANKCSKLIVVTINSKAIEGPDVPGSWWNWGLKSDMGYTIKNKNELKKDPMGLCDMLIINYESLYKREGPSSPRTGGVRLRDEIINFIKNAKKKDIAIILDESHKVKNLDTLQTKAIRQLITQCFYHCGDHRYLYLLTGTPFTTGFIDLYAQLKLLGCPMNKNQFIENFCVRGNVRGLLGWQQPIVGYKNLGELYELIHQYAITIKSDDVVKLPEKVFVNHPTKESETFRLLTREKLPEKLINLKLDLPTPAGRSKTVPNPFYRNLDYPEINYLADTAGAFWLRCRQASIGFQGNEEKFNWYDDSRLKSLEAFLEENPDNYILFYNYVPELIKLYEVCEKLKFNIDVFSGEIKSTHFYDIYAGQDEAQRLINKNNILIANFASGSTGMNWQAYNKCIVFSTPLYKDWEQGIKRIHRIGQKETTIYHLFYQENWLDASMKKALDDKVQYSEDMFKSDLLKLKEELK